jgi:glycosyltransferase involved in cell wall biosynthesis
MKVAIVTPAIQDPGRLFGAERLFAGMVEAFQRRYDTDWIEVAISEATWDDVLRAYLDCYELDLSAYDLVISTKTPTFMAQHPNHVCWLLHQVRVFYDRFDDEYGKLGKAQLAEKYEQRKMIAELDNLAFQGVRKIFSIGHEPSRRLKHYNGYDSEVIYPPVLTRGQYCAAQEYFLLPGRLHRWKRVDLALRAMQHLPGDTPLLIPGTGEDEKYFRDIAGDDPRIAFLGFVSDQELLDLYANALAVLFLPKDEDFGYIAVEAMLSHKPVIVCCDSGEPARLVENGRSGYVVAAEPIEIAAAMSILDDDRELARTMGEYGYQHVPSQSWDEVVDRLVAAGAPKRAQSFGSPAPREPAKNEVSLLVADNQVLDPPVGGGRIRIYELYRNVAALGFEVTYVGAYDWPGPIYRDQMLAPHFRECVTPLTQWHFAEDAKYRAATGGKTTIDVTIPKLLKHSPRFQRMAEEFGREAKIIVISHPWVYPYVPRRADQKLIYDAHNCEYVVKQQILGDTRAGRELVREVGELEGNLCREADLIFVCSDDDATQFAERYGVSREKMVLVPNGVDTKDIQPATIEQRQQARRDLGLPMERPVMIFIGSGYGPNTEAAMFLVKEVAPLLSECTIAIAGSVKESYEAVRGPEPGVNVRFLGVIDANQRRALYQAADIALNPMFSGSGTNLKMLDYFAAGLPVVSTAAGARGLDITANDCVVCVTRDFVSRVQELTASEAVRIEMGRRARLIAEEKYDWASISAKAAESMVSLLQSKTVSV